jgi:hypothetical protein
MTDRRSSALREAASSRRLQHICAADTKPIVTNPNRKYPDVLVRRL